MTISAKLGFEIRQIMRDAKSKFDEGGYHGLVSFVKASIRSGVTQIEDIVGDAIAVTGEHIEDSIRTLLMEGENEHWWTTPDGTLKVIGYDGEQ